MREALINLEAISANVAHLSALVETDHCLVVVKANAYGHGAVASARAALAGGADWLGVADITEARELRDGGIAAPVLAWLHGSDADLAGAVAAEIDLGVNSFAQLERVATATGTANVHLKFDTGLGRNGVAPQDRAGVIQRAVECEKAGAIRVRGVFSHLADAGAAADLDQVSRFDGILDEVRAAGLSPELVHLAATAGAVRVPRARYTMVRIGVGAYGLSPFPDGNSAAIGLRPAMTLSAELVSVKRVAAGTGVSYGHDYVARRDTTLALVPLGYADGIPRRASGRGPVSINGETFSIAGRVAMDQFVVDIGDLPAREGDRAILFGDPEVGVPSASDWAVASETINYEIVTRIGHRVSRRYTS
ncbi:MAG: alanine racemase [Microbacteriaceae bacterium]